MKTKLTITLIFFVFSLHAQIPKIHFEYDDFGNQIERKFCPSCLSKITIKNLKLINDITEEDLLKFFPNDVISYYPNPVKEELFLKWELINGNKVTMIEIYTINGQLIKSYNELNDNENLIIPYSDYPTGTYFINLRYTNGENKSIKILKN
jgi:hypothetical protein